MKLRLPRRAAALALPMLGILSASALHGCSSKPAAGIVLAMTTDVIVPEDIDAVAIVFTNAETGAAIARPYVRPTAPSKAGNAVRFPSTLTLETAFDGGTFSFGTPKRKVANVQIALVGLKGGTSPSDGEARMLRRVTVAMPETGLSLLKLNLDLLSLGGAEGKLDAGQASELSVKNLTTPGLGNVRSTCSDPALDYVAGACQPPPTLAAGALPSAESPTGNELEQAAGAEATCFDIPTSFGPNAPVEKVVLNDKCELKVPSGAYALAFERSKPPVVGSNADKATCITQAGVRRCLTVLDPPDAADPFAVYAVKDGTATFAPAFCAALKNGTAVGATIPKGLYLTTARAKDAPVCAPWSSVQNDNNPYKDFSDGGVVTLNGDVTFLPEGATLSVDINGVEKTLKKGPFSFTIPAVPWTAKVSAQPSINGAPTGQYCSFLHPAGPAVSANGLEVRCVLATTTYGGDSGTLEARTLGPGVTASIPDFPAQTLDLPTTSDVLFMLQIPTVAFAGGTPQPEVRFGLLIDGTRSAELSTVKLRADGEGTPTAGNALVNLGAGTHTFQPTWSTTGGSVVLYPNDGRGALKPALTTLVVSSFSSYLAHRWGESKPNASLPTSLTSALPPGAVGEPVFVFGDGVSIADPATAGFTATVSVSGLPVAKLSSASATASGTMARNVPFFAFLEKRGVPTTQEVAFASPLATNGITVSLRDGSALGGVALSANARVATATRDELVPFTAVAAPEVPASLPAPTPLVKLDLPDVADGQPVLVFSTIESTLCAGNGAAHAYLSVDGTTEEPRSFFLSGSKDYAMPHFFAMVAKKKPGVPFRATTQLRALNIPTARTDCYAKGRADLTAWAL